MNSNPTVLIGAGAVGLAIARELATSGQWVVVLEKERSYGRGVSSRNSEVIHAGIYYDPGSLKARMCVEGRRLLYPYLAARGVPHNNCGKIIVATDDSEIPHLDRILQKANANGVESMHWLSKAEVERLEPAVQAVAGLYSATTGIVSAHAFMDALYADACSAGCDFAFGMELIGAEQTADGWLLTVRSHDGLTEAIEAGVVINSAGLHSDTIAALVLPQENAERVRLNWVKGNYFTIRSSAKVNATHLIYPCPRADQRGLGVHLTIDLAGDQKLGPDVHVLPQRVEAYDVDDRLRPLFAEAARRFLPSIRDDDLAPGYSGLRPQRASEGFRDFYIQEESGKGAPRWLNLVGIESPGLTCALAIAAHVRAKLSKSQTIMPRSA